MYVWVFNAENASFPGGVFSSAENAEHWIAEHELSGTLTAYPLDVPVYRWAVESGFYPASKPVTTRFIGSFSSAHQPHHHFENGARKG